ncbi:MAG: TIGR04282 family arsenosugar biosynthesis glycosyltransferase [Myxococcales bacterium]|nr:TIGR04282 family arsenosugar biosynthesis glycosyltransferase [Myxococcales bacterium]
MAKPPRPGEVKTRMTPPLTPEQAAALYACLLDDVLASSARIAAACALDPVLAVHPASACDELARRCPAAFGVLGQRGADLGERMERAIEDALSTGAERVLLRGSDSPMLDMRHVLAALAALETHDLAVCPDRDGGYSLVGVRAAVPGLFAHPMSTRRVLDDTLAAARRRGLRVSVEAPCFDLDRVADLRWLAEARGRGAESLCPRTLAHLDARDLWRLVPDLGSEARAAPLAGGQQTR